MALSVGDSPGVTGVDGIAVSTGGHCTWLRRDGHAAARRRCLLGVLFFLQALVRHARVPHGGL